ncbi:thermostable hemolysin [Beijerinckia indica]|uniref:Thermostable hemolysin n=1 Tax=Beijerinckia indica subsp. indica (strain ATCC 9039 / DSM 1715 / NCIMB 8712) TaxID=395963 RepID=B2IIX1_BEII9|nr:thermostable hemolysin [Beijerinckia indica]ACB96183.1 conserved hypothetical protein [Beijerinckia indica subsp. indica ATCC 9039]
MANTIILYETDPLRAKAETFINEIYSNHYDATIGKIATPLIARVSSHGNILCAAGLRSERDGFFSEIYLEAPIESMLSAVSHRKVSRSDIFEVSSLASRAPHAIAGFIEDIVAFGEDTGFSWSFFTLTSRLSLMLERIGFALTYLGVADRRRIVDVERWGKYYTTEPKVYAVESTRFHTYRGSDKDKQTHAHDL